MHAVPESTRRELVQFMIELTRQQNADGSWVERTATLQSVVVTCQALLFITEFRGALPTRATKKAVQWLLSPAVNDTEYTYWRGLPLIKAGAPGSAVDDAVEHLRQTVGQILHHKNSPIEPFYVDCLIMRDRQLDDTARTLITKWAHMLAKGNLQPSPEHVAYVLYAYCGSQPQVDPGLLAKGMDELAKHSRYEGTVRHWDTLVATSYIVLSLLRLYEVCNDASVKTTAASLAREASIGLVRAWENEQFASDPLAGGDFQGTPYNRLIVARAIAAMADHEDPGWREDYWVERYDAERSSKRTLVFLSLGLGLLAVGHCLVPWAAKALGSTSVHWTRLARVADVLGVGAVVVRGVQLLYARYSPGK